MGHLPFRNLLSFSLHISENYGNNLIVRMEEEKNVSVSDGEVIDNLIKKKEGFFSFFEGVWMMSDLKWQNMKECEK